MTYSTRGLHSSAVTCQHAEHRPWPALRLSFLICDMETTLGRATGLQ